MPFLAPDFEFHVERAHGIDENEQENGIFRAVQVANAPRERDDGQVDQIWVERGAADTAHKRDAEEPRQEALARKEAQHKHAVNENREAMVHKVIVARIHARTHEEKAPVQGEQQNRLHNAAHVVLLEPVEDPLAVKAEKHHAKQIFKNAHRRKHVEKAVLRIEAAKPKIIRTAKHDRPKDSRDEHDAKQHPERPAVLPEQPAAHPRRNGVAKEKARQRPRRFIQLHAQIGNDGPREREVHEQAPPRMEHLRKPCRSAIADFGKSRQMAVAAHLEHDDHEHEERHEEVQPVKFRDAAEHKGNHGNAAFRVAELAREEETSHDIKNACSKGRGRNNGHQPLAVGQVGDGAGTAQVEHHDIEARQQAQAVYSWEVIRGFRHFEVEI